MGCDIHGVLQVRENGRWRDVGAGFEDRNYDAFAILADVRNGRGFAGIETGTQFEPIDQPRGLPYDFEMGAPDDEGVHDEYSHPIPADFQYADDWSRNWHAEHPEKARWMGDHSHTWVGPADFEKVDWQATHRSYGVITLAEFRELGGAGRRPTGSYCGGISGRDVVQMEAAEVMDKEEDLHPGKRVFVRTWWDETYAEAVGERFMAFVRQVADLAKGYGPDNVRFVCGFDS